MSIEATIAITVQWLCKHRPVVFTNRTKDQPLLADQRVFGPFDNGSAV